MRVETARVTHHPHRHPSKGLGLEAAGSLWSSVSIAVRADTCKHHGLGLVLSDDVPHNLPSLHHFFAGELGRARRHPVHQVGKANAALREHGGILVGKTLVGVHSIRGYPCGLKRGPKAVAWVGEGRVHLLGEAAWVDADDEEPARIGNTVVHTSDCIRPLQRRQTRCTVCAVMNDSTVSRAPVVLGTILCVLVAVLLVAPRILSQPASSNESAAPENPVEMGSVTVADGDGPLVCNNPSGFAQSSRIWDCGGTRIMARSESTPDDEDRALARVYRAAVLDRSVDLDGIEQPRDGVRVKRNGASGDGAFVAVSVLDDASTQYFTIGGPDADELADRVVAAAPEEMKVGAQ